MVTKLCSACNIEKELNLFEKKGIKQPIGSRCKDCKNRIDREKNKNNREEFNKKCRKFYNDNKDSINSTRRKNMQMRRDNDPKYRAMMALHCRLYMAVTSKKGNTMELTGCSKDELQQYLESKFTDGMCWDNYGKWHIDHIRPCSSFNLEELEEQKECFHFSNLQPLWALDNIRKSNKW